MAKRQVIVISTFAKDEIFYVETGKTKVAIGGPAFWIRKTLKNLDTKHSIISSKKKAVTKIIAKGGEETGSLVFVPKIKITKKEITGNFIISTLGNEFQLGEIKKLNGMVAIDMQGYARVARGKIRIPKNVAGRITIMKATRNELKKLDKRVVADQKNRVLVVTNGKKGFEVFSEKKRYIFKPNVIKTKDTLGAGDVFLASFVVEYIKTRSALRAAGFARSYVEKFLKTTK